MELICGYCIAHFMNAASMIFIRYPDGTDKIIHSYGVRGLKEVQDELNGNSQAQLGINADMIIGGMTPVTQIAGTLVCYTHMMDAFDREMRRR